MITVVVVVMCIGFFVNRQTTRGKTLGRFDQRNVQKKKNNKNNNKKEKSKYN